MLGLHDPWIIGAYLCCILSAVVCIVYGFMFWNRGAEDEATQIMEEANWESDERKVESNL